MIEKKYDPKSIEKKWQKYWEDHDTYHSEVDKSKPKYYVLDMFPYPSGSGLHVGHVVGYTGSDVIARYKRQKGFNVLHPMGWDSFGLPAEQYAIRTGTHPQITTENNIATYKRQLKSLGFSYDWKREFATSDPKYYKWTQSLFIELYKKGLAYEAEVTVNFCPDLGTVLSNEEVENGKSVEGGYPIIRKPLKQWMLKITAYAERLLADLDSLDWPDHLKKLQTNWIGKSEGANVSFPIVDSKEKIQVFTTRQDTLFGVTFLALAPEHPLVEKLTKSKYKSQVKEYLELTRSKSDLERTDLAKTKTGVFTGSYAINPVTNDKIPIWIADYILINYGLGAIMGVPGHDDRDEEFAEIYNLPITMVIDEEGNYINSTSSSIDLAGLSTEGAKEVVIEMLEKNQAGERAVHYKLRDWLFSRQRYWGEPFPILHYEDGTKRVLNLTELPLTPPIIEDYKPSPDGRSPLAKMTNWVEIKDPITGKKAFRETNTMPQWAGSCWYYLRFIDPLNTKEAWDKEKEAYWMPVDLYIGGVEHAVLHLLYARFWHKVFYDIGLVSTSEPFQQLRNQGLVVSQAFKLDGGGWVAPDDVEEVNGTFQQKGTKKRVTPMIEKMSKSKLNGVSPDEIIEEIGADALRLYELFLTPFDKEKHWKSEATAGSKRFLNRVYELVVSDKIVEEESEESNKLIHKLVKVVGADLEVLSFNTAIAKMMEFLNSFAKLDKYPRNHLKAFIQLIYPFAPHFGEECWSLLGGTGTISYVPFPTYDEKWLKEDIVTIVFQVMGKIRGMKEFSKGVTEEEVFKEAKLDTNFAKYLSGEIVKVIYVPDKLINVVVK